MIIQYGPSSYVLAVSQGDDRLSPSAEPNLLTIRIHILQSIIYDRHLEEYETKCWLDYLIIQLVKLLRT
jgi:hypothetical protein